MTTTTEDDGLRAIDTDEIAAVLFAQRQTPYVWADAIDAPAESDEGTLVSICRDDAAAVLAALRSSPAVDGVGEPVAWMATSQNGSVMVKSAILKSLLIERANTLYGNGAYELTPLWPRSALSPTSDSASVTSRVLEYKKRDGTSDFFVALDCGDRQVTPYSFSERWKAEYEVATFEWLFGRRDKPDFDEFDPPAGRLALSKEGEAS